MQNKPSIASEELAKYLIEKDQIKVGNVFDSDREFFVVTKVDIRNDIVLVTGDIITDHEWSRQITFGRSVLLALYPTKYLDSVWDNHIWGGFYDKSIARVADTF